MHLIGLLVAVMSGAAFWYWRLKMVRDAGSEIIDSVERMRGAYKRKQFRKNAIAAPLATIADPAIAAIVFYLCLADQKPFTKSQAVEVIRARMTEILAPNDLEDVLVFGEWAQRSIVEPRDLIRRFRELWMTRLSGSERDELIAIAGAVANAAGETTGEQTEILNTLRSALAI